MATRIQKATVYATIDEPVLAGPEQDVLALGEQRSA